MKTKNITEITILRVVITPYERELFFKNKGYFEKRLKSYIDKMCPLRKNYSYEFCPTSDCLNEIEIKVVLE